MLDIGQLPGLVFYNIHSGIVYGNAMTDAHGIYLGKFSTKIKDDG